MAIQITVPPTIRPGGNNIVALQQAINTWTKMAQQNMRSIGNAVNSASAITETIANSTTTGLLSSTDWNIFNGKQPAGTYLTDAPDNGTLYGRKSAAWVPITLPSGGNLTETGSSVLTITGGTGAVIGSGTTIDVTQATSSASGYLSSTDWNTFNNKVDPSELGALTESGSDVLQITYSGNPVVGNVEIQVNQASGSQDGYLSATDWTTFNNKLSSLTFGNLSTANHLTLNGVSGGTSDGAIIGGSITLGLPNGNLTETGSSVLTITGGTGAVIGSGTTIDVTQATSSTSGYLASTDWNTFNNKVGSLPGWIASNPRTPPLTSNAMNDEFSETGTSLSSLWSWLYSPSGLAISYINDGLLITFPGTNTAKMFAFTQSLPGSGAWEFISYMNSLPNGIANYGLLIYESSSTKSLLLANGSTSNDYSISLIEYTGTTAGSTVASTNFKIPTVSFLSPVWLKIGWDGSSNLYFNYSGDGILWYNLYTTSFSAGFFSTGPNEIGIGGFNPATTLDTGYYWFDFFRRTI